MCVCAHLTDAETEAPKSSRTADVTRKEEAEKSMVFLWPHVPPQRPPTVKALTLCQPQAFCDILAFFPFSSRMSVRRVRKENHSVHTNS